MSQAPGPDSRPRGWPSPEDAEQEWHYDRDRQAGPVPPLYADTLGRWWLAARDAAAGPSGLSPSRGLRLNGYWYTTRAPATAPSAAPPGGLGSRWEGEWSGALAGWLTPWAEWPVAERSPSELALLLIRSDDEGPRILRVAEDIRAAATVVWDTFQRDYRQWLGADVAPTLTVADAPANYETSRALWRLKDKVAAAGSAAPWLREAILDASPGNLHDTRAAHPAGRVWLAAWDRFLDHHGRRCDEGGGLGPSWVEDPAVPLRLLQAYLDDVHRPANEQWRQVRSQRDALAAEAAARVPKWAHFGARLSEARWAHELLSHRTDDVAQQVAYRLRRVVAAIGDCLVEAGCLTRRGEVIYLTREECLTALHSPAAPLYPLARRRQAELEHQASWPPPPVAGGRHRPRMEPTHTSDTAWQGVAAAPGRVRGPVRVAATLGEAAAARPGEILVAPLVTSQWAAGLPLVSGVVAAGGGHLASAGLTAAEFGLPAVTGIAGVTEALHSGEWIEVDGTRGTVHRLDG